MVKTKEILAQISDYENSIIDFMDLIYIMIFC